MKEHFIYKMKMGMQPEKKYQDFETAYRIAGLRNGGTNPKNSAASVMASRCRPAVCPQDHKNPLQEQKTARDFYI